MKVKLTNEEVLEIFAQRAELQQHESNALTSKELATRYRVSERTVRDIWNRRTRRDLTEHEWTAEEHAEQIQKKQGRPRGAKDSVPRQRQSQQAPSNFTQGSSSETASEDFCPLESISSTDCDSVQGTGDAQYNKPISALEPGRNGLLFNQAVLALLLQGIRPPPLSPSAPGTAPFLNLLESPCPPAVPPFTSPQQVQASLFGGARPHASLSLHQQPSSTVPPPVMLPLSTSSMKSPHVTFFAPNAAGPASSPHQQLQPQQSMHLPQAHHASSQLRGMLNTIISPSTDTDNSNVNAKKQSSILFTYPVPPFEVATQAQASATDSSFEFPGIQQTSSFKLHHANGQRQRFLNRLPNAGVVPGGETSEPVTRMGTRVKVATQPPQSPVASVRE